VRSNFTWVVFEVIKEDMYRILRVRHRKEAPGVKLGSTDDDGTNTRTDMSQGTIKLLFLLAAGLMTVMPAQLPDAHPTSGNVDSFSAAEFTLPCLVGRTPLLEQTGSPVVLGTDELNRRATRTAAVTAPQGTTAPKTVTVYIAIDEAGRVLCASLTKNSRDRLGRIGILALEAAKKWLFQPVLKHKKPVLCMGQLELEIVAAPRPEGSSAR
jgi:hypothetical protein